eukprot:9014892-Pyramimonas_sp.AAC.1
MHEVWVYSHNGPIRHSNYGYILAMNISSGKFTSLAASPHVCLYDRIHTCALQSRGYPFIARQKISPGNHAVMGWI